jgi:hypothetical protein
LFETFLLERLCLLGRDFEMISYRRRRDAPQSLQDNNIYIRVMRTFLYGLRARRRPTKMLDRVPRKGPNHNRVVVGKRET